MEFWTQFNEILEERGKPFNKRKASTDSWYSIAFGSAQCYINVDLVNREHKIIISNWIPDNKDLFDKLFQSKENIEKEANINFEWERMDNKKTSRISTYIDGLDFENQDNYKELMNNTIDKVVLLKNVFKKYI